MNIQLPTALHARIWNQWLFATTRQIFAAIINCWRKFQHRRRDVTVETLLQTIFHSEYREKERDDDENLILHLHRKRIIFFSHAVEILF